MPTSNGEIWECFGNESHEAAFPGIRRLISGEPLYEQGRKCQSVYLIRSGLLELVIPNPLGGHRRLRLGRPDDILGLSAALGDGYYGETALSLERSVVRVGSSKSVLTYLSHHPAVWAEVLQKLSAEASASGHLLRQMRTTSPV